MIICLDNFSEELFIAFITQIRYFCLNQWVKMTRLTVNIDNQIYEKL